ncbi:hypothetical protein QUA62_03300 [Microcoleus sp. MON1_C1]|uniref:hypothetical protein n=1 Tax=Microcoleus sp. MON1_C1 TaxID=2818827 RepID=UPI002FD1F4EB
MSKVASGIHSRDLVMIQAKIEGQCRNTVPCNLMSEVAIGQPRTQLQVTAG